MQKLRQPASPAAKRRLASDVIRKLTVDLKIPFRLQDATRLDDTMVHQALREALTNTLIHADYTGRVSILVVKRPNLFGFRNPGMLRVSLEQAMAGGISDCRNNGIQNLFRFVGLGDHAGSGIPSILKSWQSQHWRTPLLYEEPIHDQTLLELRTLSLLPEESVKHLETLFANIPDFIDLLAEKLSEWKYSRMPRKLNSNKMQELILFLCSNQWIPLAELSKVLERNSKSLQDQYLTSMLTEGMLQLKYPETKNHPAQAYRTRI